MKNISLVLNVVLLIAVIVLFVLHFKGQPAGSSEEAVSETISDVLDTAAAKQSKIAYVNMDVVLDNYKLYNDLEKELMESQRQMEAQLDSKSKTFQENYAAFMEKAQRGGFLTQQSAEYAEQQLMEEQQQLQQLEMNLTQQIAEEQQAMNERLYDSLEIFVEEFNKDFNYDFILSNSFGGILLYGNKTYNLTDTVLNGLNSRYETYKANQDSESE